MTSPLLVSTEISSPLTSLSANKAAFTFVVSMESSTAVPTVPLVEPVSPDVVVPDVLVDAPEPDVPVPEAPEPDVSGLIVPEVPDVPVLGVLPVVPAPDVLEDVSLPGVAEVPAPDTPDPLVPPVAPDMPAVLSEGVAVLPDGLVAVLPGVLPVAGDAVSVSAERLQPLANIAPNKVMARMVLGYFNVGFILLFLSVAIKMT